MYSLPIDSSWCRRVIIPIYNGPRRTQCRFRQIRLGQARRNQLVRLAAAYWLLPRQIAKVRHLRQVHVAVDAASVKLVLMLSTASLSLVFRASTGS